MARNKTRELDVTRETKKPMGLSSLFQRPDQHLEPFGEVQQRLDCGQLDAGGRGHGIYGNFTFRILQRPGLVVDLGSINGITDRGVEAIAFAEPVLKGSGLS